MLVLCEWLSLFERWAVPPTNEVTLGVYQQPADPHGGLSILKYVLIGSLE